MASSYSPLKIELMATGENSGTWGDITNTNLGTALEEAITGSADVTFASANVTLTLTNTNASQTARNLRLNLTGTTGGARDLIVPSIEKLYLVYNGCADTVTVKTSGGTGVAVATGRSTFVFSDGTNVVDALRAISVASGGTGAVSLTANSILIGNGTSTLLGLAPGTAGNVAVSDGTQWGSGTAPRIGAGNSSIVITDTGSNGTIAFTTEGSERMRIDSAGNVGIGTSSPAAKLHVQNTNTDVRIGESNDGLSYYNPTLITVAQRPLAIGDGNVISSGGGLHLYGNTNSGIKSQGAITVGCSGDLGTYRKTATSNSGILFIDGSLQFCTDAGLTVNSDYYFPTRRMVIDSTGNVGIGTSSPGGNLDVVTSTNSNASVASFRNSNAGNASATTLRIGTDVSTGSATITMHANANTSASNRLDIFNVINDNGSAIAFGTRGTERMLIDSAGNVGIGVTNPGSYAAYARTLVVGKAGNTDAGITIVAGSTSGYSSVLFADGTGATENYQGILEYAHAVDAMGVYSNGYANGFVVDSTAGTYRASISGGNFNPAFFARAWVNFNGTGTVAIRASGNVSSITDNGTGDYTVNFTTAMPDANYAAVFGAYKSSDSGGQNANVTARSFAAPAGTTTALRINTQESSSFLDSAYVDVAIFR